MIPPLKGGNFNQAPFSSPMIDITCCNVLKRGAKREPVLQESLPLRGSRGMGGRAPSARGEGIRGAPSSLSRRLAHLNVGGGQHDPIVCCGGISTGCIRPRIRRP